MYQALSSGAAVVFFALFHQQAPHGALFLHSLVCFLSSSVWQLVF